MRSGELLSLNKWTRVDNLMKAYYDSRKQGNSQTTLAASVFGAQMEKPIRTTSLVQWTT